ncbi:MAG: sulfite exporter TauE/SafE family protein [Ignavibacteria bacterium]|nr:sulfite exporter TauE/SafE family protein [Ignavibacteria bacterium]MBT8382193.1 sulfite exporter TauE/SafE family protein [Ignavibacteria bacterium]MBT8390189.1 sulfite exporter TauE/SafE family protein [Ignavibacteria bacterium]NNJ53995.1 sulfite exporter TauE/SafE family protein [Ignavibacteriaceae bacterium]NNL21175.1 sulfite exporter TauE/SafE family protein [Ignavibacteriaceae bacterium]
MNFNLEDIEIAFWIPPLVAFLISFFASMGGLSGAFLLLPFNVSILGFNTPSVSSTNHLYNSVAIPGGVYRYIKEGRMVWPLTAVIIIGTLPGVILGTLIRVNYLPDAKNFKLFAAGVLIYIGFNLIRDLLGKKKKQDKSLKDKVENKAHPKVVVKQFSLLKIIYNFNDETFRINSLAIFFLCLAIGIVGGVYGIGGGAILAPILITVFALPVYTIAGPSLMGTFVTSLASVIFYQIIAPYYSELNVAPNWMLGFLYGIGGFIGIYFGARAQKFMPAKFIKWILVFCIFLPAVKYIWDFWG